MNKMSYQLDGVSWEFQRMCLCGATDWCPPSGCDTIRKRTPTPQPNQSTAEIAAPLLTKYQKETHYD